MYLYSINIDLHSSNYHIQVIDIRSYNKDSYCISSHSQATLLVGVHPVQPTISQNIKKKKNLSWQANIANLPNLSQFA